MQDQTPPGKDALSVYFFQIADAAQKETKDPSRTFFPMLRQGNGCSGPGTDVSGRDPRIPGA